MKDQATVALICQLMPKDRPWSIPEMLQRLREAAPDRKFAEMTVRTYCSNLARRGLIRNLHKTRQKYSRWIAAECSVQDGPLEARSMVDVIEIILREAGQPMTAAEIRVAMQERGCRPDTAPQIFMRAIRDIFKR
jgi:hypothetical protein